MKYLTYGFFENSRQNILKMNIIENRFQLPGFFLFHFYFPKKKLILIFDVWGMMMIVLKLIAKIVRHQEEKKRI